MLIDPLVLKKKLNRMATEQGSFAILSSLLLYVTELSAGDPQISNKRTKWAEGKENKVSSNQPCPGPIRVQHPTRFQLLRSRFLNNNREPYTKKRREVGKLVIKEKLWVSRAGNKLDRSRDRKGDEKAAEEDADTAPSDRARWSSMTGKNTVKNILKKFLAAEEKEAKEKSPSWKKKGANSCLPKIVNRSSVLSKLKEQFEQNALCSAAEVKALPLRKGEKKTKNFPSRKTIHKPEVRVLRMAAMTATGIKSPESQNLVCSTVPVPRLSMATKINHPWSWSKNNATKQPSGHDTLLKEKEGSNRDCDESKMLVNAAQDRKDREDREELLVALEAMSDEKDCAETKIDSTKQELNFHPVLDNSSTTYENKALADCIVPLSECSLDSDRNNMPAATDTSSLLGITNALQHIKEDSLPSDSPYSNTAKGSHEQSPQDTTLGEIPEITMYVYTSEEYDTELTEPEKDPFFPRQKCSPEQKVLENILPLHSPGVQASCEVEPPMDARQLTVLIPASGKKPPIVQKEALDLGGKCSEEGKEEAKIRSEDKFSLTSSKNNGDVPNTEEEENKAPNSQMQNEYKTTQPQLPQITFMPQNNFDDSNANISNSDANQKRPTVSSNENQVPKPGTAEEEYISPPLDKTQSPLPGDLVKHSSYIAEDFGKDKLSSTNEMMNHANNRSLHRSIVTDLETCHKSSKSFIQHEEATADEMPWPDSETWQSPLSTPLSISLSEMAGQSIHHTLRSPPALPPMDLVRQGAGGVGHEHTSHGCGEQSPRPSDDLINCGNDTTVEKKATSDFKNQTLSSNHATEDENSTDKETNTCQRFENCLSLSTKKPEKHENKTILARKPLLPLEKNQTSPVDDTKKQGCDMLEENPIPLSTELVSNQKKHEKSRKKISEHTRDKLFSSDDDMKHESDRMETEEKEERNVLHKFDPEQIFPPNATVDHDNSSSKDNNVHRPQTSQLPSSEHDINIQGVKNTGQSLEDPAPSRDFVKHENDMTGDENICCNNRKSHLASSDEPMKLANDSAGLKNSKSNFNNYSMPPRITSRQDNKTTDEDNTSLETEMSPGDFVKPEIKLDKKETKHTSVKLQSPSSYKVPNHQDRSSSEERKQKTPAAEDNRSTETKVVKEDNEHQLSGKHQLPLSRKSEMHEENIAGGDKQQMRSEGFPTPDKNTAKQKDKFPSSRKYRSLSSETLVKPQAKNTPEQMQQTSASSGFKKPGTNVKEKDGDPNPEKSPSSNIVLKPQEKSSSGERKQKTPVAEDTRSHEEKAAKEYSKYQCSGKHQLPPSNKLSKPEKNVEGGKNTKPITKSFTKSDANVVKDKNRDPNSGMGQSPYSNLLMKPQENNATAKKEQLPPSHDKNPMYKTGSPEKKSEPKRREKYQLGSSAHSEKQSSDGSGEKGPVYDLMSYQAPLPSNSKNCKSSTVPKKTSLSHTEKSPKSSSSFHVASKDEENPAGNRKNLPGFKKYKVLSSKTLVRHENDAAEREGTWQAAGKTSDKKAELENCSKVTPFSKYTVESYSEGPLDSAFKPLIIRVTDTFKHHS